MTGFPDRSDLAVARAAGRDRAPDGMRLKRFVWAPVGGAVLLFPVAPVPDGPGVGARFAIGRPGGAAPLEVAYWIAHAVRQDLWRCLRDLRGLWPVVRVEPQPAGLSVMAGGLLPATAPRGTEARIAALATPGRQRQWVRWANRQRRDTTRG